jgi:hypothetical protein
MMAIPDRPRRVAVAVKIFKFLAVLKVIHARPEAIMGMGQKLLL